MDYPRSSDESRDVFEDYLKNEGLWEQMLGFNAGSFKSYAKSNWCPDLVPAPFKDMVSFGDCQKGKSQEAQGCR